jgi:hypothetical protein
MTTENQTMEPRVEDFTGPIPPRVRPPGMGRPAGPELTKVRSLKEGQRVIFTNVAGAGEDFVKKAKTLTAKFDRKGAVPFDIASRTYKDKNEVHVFRPVVEAKTDAANDTPQDEGVNENAKAANKMGPVTVALPAPAPGKTLTATLANGEKVTISSN